jgi:hypothetical protein
MRLISITASAACSCKTLTYLAFLSLVLLLDSATVWAADTCCYTADPTTESSQMLLNVTVKYAPAAAESSYNITATFPLSYTMGPQPYRSPLSSVTCQSMSDSTSRYFTCATTGATNFFAIFNMITPNREDPQKGISLYLTDSSKNKVDCDLAVWCPDISTTPTGYVYLPGLGYQPPWFVLF